MNLLQPQFILVYGIVIGAAIWAILLASSKSTRQKQWLWRSTAIGLPLGPLLWLATGMSLDTLRQISLLGEPGYWLELAALSALTWGNMATVGQAVRLAPKAMRPVAVSWLKIGVFLLSALIGATIASAVDVVPGIGIVASTGLLAVGVIATYPHLLKTAGALGTSTALILVAIGYGLTFFTPALAQFTLGGVLASVFTLTTITLLSLLAFSATAVSWWWFNQPPTTAALKSQE
jgi:hypothetical protein